MGFPTEERRTRRRSRSTRKLLIHPRFQLIFLGCMAAFAAICTAGGYWISSSAIRQFEQAALDAGLSIDHSLFTLIGEKHAQSSRVFVASTLLIWLVLCIGGLLVSHWIAGPIYRIINHMNRLTREGATEETLHSVKLRRSDFFPELAEAYNRVLKLLHKRP